MKAIRHLTLAMFLVSFTGIAAYGQVCHADRATPGTTTVQLGSNYIPPGTNVTWGLSISLWNEESYNYTFAAADIIGGPTAPTLQYRDSGNYYGMTANKSGVWNDVNVGQVLLYCVAEQGPRDSGGHADATASVLW